MRHLPQDEDVLFVLVSVGGVKGTHGQVEQWLVVVGHRRVPGVLVEADLALLEDAVKVHPRLAANGDKGMRLDNCFT